MKIIKKFIAECVCKGIELYVSKYRFGMHGQIEIYPMTHKEFEKYIYETFTTKEAAQEYLEETKQRIQQRF